uniref:Uncharacterized protein n=1 Tax=Oryza rufipogon TaxID=4529 RepID=A0A0E0N3S5_ORYRU
MGWIVGSVSDAGAAPVQAHRRRRSSSAARCSSPSLASPPSSAAKRIGQASTTSHTTGHIGKDVAT